MKKLIKIWLWALCSLCVATSALSEEYWTEAGTEIDRLIHLKLEANGKDFAPAVSDDLFLRRCYLSIIGRIPTVAEIQSFNDQSAESRRDTLIDALLASPGYESHMFNFWADLLRIKENLPGLTQGGIPYADWIKQQIRANTPYDRMVFEMITSHGDTWNKEDGATGFYRRDAGMPLDHFSLTMQTFSGVQMQCAQCHNHPFESWTQKQFFEMAAFLNMRQNVLSENAFPMGQVKKHYKEDFKTQGATRETLKSAYNTFNDILGKSVPNQGRGVAQLPNDYQYTNGKPKERITARTIMGEEVIFDPATATENSRVVFAKWLTSQEHEYFTRVIVNRLWKRVMGLGLYEPVDDIREDTVVDNAALLAYLEDQLKELDYDLKKFIRLLHSTSVYARESQLYAMDSAEPYDFRGPLMRRMSSEQLWDSVMTLREPKLDTLKAGKRKGYYSSYNLLTKMDQEQVIEFVDSLVDSQTELGHRRGGVHRELAAMSEGVAYSPSVDESTMMSMSADEQLVNLYADKPDAIVTLYKHPAESKALRQYYGQFKNFKKAKKPQKANEVKAKAIQELRGIGLTAKEISDCFKYYKRMDQAHGAKLKYARASELGSPAPKGHFLRIFGSSDREFIDNGSLEGSTPQALEMMNGFINYGVLQQAKSVLNRDLKGLSVNETIDYLYLALLTRSPSVAERERLLQFADKPSWTLNRDMAWAIVNGPEFSFFY